MSAAGSQAGERRIVVGIDGSSASAAALRWAATQARLSEALLEVVHARFLRKVASEMIEGAETEDESILEQGVREARQLEPTIEVVGRIEDPPAARRLIDASKGADLLVVGSRGLGGFKELLVGSVSQQCVHYAHCPVVVVRPQTLKRRSRGR